MGAMMKRVVFVVLAGSTLVAGRWLTPAFLVAQTPPIAVAPNVHVSPNHSNDILSESWISADPADPKHLLICAMGLSPANRQPYVVAYLSTDGGSRWRETLEPTAGWDPWCTLGSDGRAHFTLLPGTGSPEVYRSSDGGATWQKQTPVWMARIDHESVVADATGGRFAGRVYMTGMTLSGARQTDGSPANGIGIWKSIDGGLTFAKPYTLAASPGSLPWGTGTGVVLRDGTVIFPVNENIGPNVEANDILPLPSTGDPNARLEVFWSTDGGETLEPAVKVSDRFVNLGWHGPELNPSLAADLGSGPFADRLYVVWVDQRAGRAQVMLASSRDNGKSWSPPQTINDVDNRPAPELAGVPVMMPTVAVNKDGVVGVSWYDRHGIPDQLGWNLRFRASLDGGETWLPSARVSSASNSFAVGIEPLLATTAGSRNRIRASLAQIQFDAGDNSGMAVDASGVFHPTWSDNRLGLLQLWTAAISVRGAVTRHGDPQLDAFDDIGERTAFVINDTKFERGSGAVLFTTRLKNTSRDTLRGPFVVRARSVTTELADSVQATNADNRQLGGGAVWKFAVPGDVLAPGAVTPERLMTFRLTGMRSLFDSVGVRGGRYSAYRSGLVDLPVVVLGKRP